VPAESATSKAPLSVPDAQAIILREVRLPAPQETALTPPALGLVLAADIHSDVDSPPHDKAMMDGYAVRCADLRSGSGTLRVLEEITAGRVPTQALEQGCASRIMTGAPIPAGADAVVMVERTRLLGDGRVEVNDAAPQPGQHILRRGAEMQRGDVVLAAGAVLRPQEFGILAAVGRAAAPVIPRPEVAVLSTGDELVEADEAPGPGQIRNSNGPMLAAQAARAGAAVRYLGIARDRPESLRPLIEQGLQAAVFLLSGGVSAGTLDLAPDLLREAGVKPHFHKVSMKPGKPALFGTRDHGDGRRTLVFALPGNPVSSFVCFELFVRPALLRLAGHPGTGGQPCTAALGEDFVYNTDRPTYHPARLQWAGQWQVRPVPWQGSADLRALAQANALLLLPPGNHRHAAGQMFTVLALDQPAWEAGA
jgi:molybdopterin molybdotransferase